MVIDASPGEFWNECNWVFFDRSPLQPPRPASFDEQMRLRDLGEWPDPGGAIPDDLHPPRPPVEVLVSCADSSVTFKFTIHASRSWRSLIKVGHNSAYIQPSPTAKLGPLALADRESMADDGKAIGSQQHSYRVESVERHEKKKDLSLDAQSLRLHIQAEMRYDRLWRLPYLELVLQLREPGGEDQARADGLDRRGLSLTQNKATEASIRWLATGRYYVQNQ